MLPLYAARIEDLGQGDFVKVDCAACQHVALLSPETLLRVWLRPRGFELKGRLHFSGAGGRSRPRLSRVLCGTQFTGKRQPTGSRSTVGAAAPLCAVEGLKFA
jgi:hypothetical protein